MGSAIRSAQALATRVHAVTPRFHTQYLVRTCRRRKLPRLVQEMLATRRPPLEQYEALAHAWHRIGSMTVPDYGPYLRHLVRTQEVGRRSALDLACGTGITTAALATEFQRVHAVDLSPHMLAAAKAELQGYSNIEYSTADFRRFELDELVDVVVCSGDALNYAQSVTELAAALQCVRRVLRPQGLFVFDMQSEKSFQRTRGLVYRYLVEELEYFQVFEYDPATQIASCCVITDRGVESHRRRLFRRGEVLAAANATGLRLRNDFEHPFLRLLARSAGRDFYVFRPAT